MQKKKRETGAGCKPHPLKGNALPFNTRLYPIDRSFLEFKYGSVTQAIASLCSGPEYSTYLMQQVERLCE